MQQPGDLTPSKALLLGEKHEGNETPQEGTTFKSTLAASESAFQGVPVLPR